jgi:hypothetical protein
VLQTLLGLAAWDPAALQHLGYTPGVAAPAGDSKHRVVSHQLDKDIWLVEQRQSYNEAKKQSVASSSSPRAKLYNRHAAEHYVSCKLHRWLQMQQRVYGSPSGSNP